MLKSRNDICVAFSRNFYPFSCSMSRVLTTLNGLFYTKAICYGFNESGFREKRYIISSTQQIETFSTKHLKRVSVTKTASVCKPTTFVVTERGLSSHSCRHAKKSFWREKIMLTTTKSDLFKLA